MKYIAKFSFANGDFTNDNDRYSVNWLRILAKSQGLVMRFRYNGPRRSKDVNRSRHSCQSMCLKRNAKEVRVYFYNS